MEPFDLADPDLPPGSVVVIDESHPGRLTESSRPATGAWPASLTPGLRLAVEGSADLVHWSDLASRAGGAAQWQPENAEAAVSVDEAGVVRVTLPVAGSVRQYVRLRASVE